VVRSAGAGLLANALGQSTHLALVNPVRQQAGSYKSSLTRVSVQALSNIGIYFAVGMLNSAPLAMLSGQRCMTLL
jgi:hypothetical protein